MFRFTAIILLAAWSAQAELRFEILGDRTGGANQAIYEQVWAEVAGKKPAFVINVGETIEAPEEWRALRPVNH